MKLQLVSYNESKHIFRFIRLVEMVLFSTQNMFRLMGKKVITILRPKILLIVPMVIQGIMQLNWLETRHGLLLLILIYIMYIANYQIIQQKKCKIVEFQK